MWIDDCPSLSILDMRSKIKKLNIKNNIDLIMVDYLQLMSCPFKRGQSREREVADLSRGMKIISKEFHIPVIVLSQLSRSNEKDKRAPLLSDLRDSGALEQDADLVAFTYRPDLTQKDAQFLIRKHKHGTTRKIDMHFEGMYCRFTEKDFYTEEGRSW